MPCSHPITTYNNARHLYKGVNRWKNTFACGFCEACISKQRAEWRVRAYYESQRCLRDGGFVLFDTLTMSDDHIKRYSDVFPNMDIPKHLDKTAFCRSDIQKFFKRLRINLRRNGYNSDGKLRYILTSEYGTSEETRGFKNTHRPHYHVLFFVNFLIEPVALSRIISRSWYLGKTDGVKPYEDCSLCPLKEYCNKVCLYQSSNYVLSERVVSRDTLNNCMKCVNYVTKYISKDMFNWVNLSQSIENLFSVVCPNYLDDYETLKSYRRFRCNVLPFHLQSNGFGLYALEAEERQFIEKYNKIRIPSTKKDVVKEISLPRYLERKLYYDFKKIDGRVVWFLNDYGLKVKCAQLDNKINSFIADYRAYDPNISSDKLYDLALYNCVYRNSFASRQDLLLPYKEYYRRMITPRFDDVPLYYNFCTEKDKYLLGKFIASSWYVNSDGEIVYHRKQYHKEFRPRADYVVVTENLCPFWHGFELLLAQFQKYKNSVGLSKDLIQIRDDAQLDRYKQLGLLK